MTGSGEEPTAGSEAGTLSDDASGEASEAVPEATVQGLVVEDSDAAELFGNSPKPAKDIIAFEVDVGGKLTQLAKAAVGVDGAFSIRLPANKKNLILAAVDANAKIVAKAILAKSPGKGKKLVVAPLSLKTSLEALVFLDIVKTCGKKPSLIDIVDLRGILTAKLAAKLIAKGQISVDIKLLARAIVLAQKVKLKVFAHLGHGKAHHDLLSAKLVLLAKLDSDLHKGMDKALAYEKFHADLDALIIAKVGLKAHAKAKLAAALTVGVLLDKLSKDGDKELARLTAAIYLAIALDVNIYAIEKGLTGLHGDLDKVDELWRIIDHLLVSKADDHLIGGILDELHLLVLKDKGLLHGVVKTLVGLLDLSKIDLPKLALEAKVALRLKILAALAEGSCDSKCWDSRCVDTMGSDHGKTCCDNLDLVASLIVKAFVDVEAKLTKDILDIESLGLPILSKVKAKLIAKVIVIVSALDGSLHH